jgi:RNA polymerase sigma-70 factor (ECF subfamily)
MKQDRVAESSAPANAEPIDLDWPSLYARHASELVRYVMKLVSDGEVAADIVQDVFVIGMKTSARLRDRAAVRAWLYGIATKRVLQFRRRRRLLEFVGFSGREAATRGLPDDEAAAVRAILRRLPPDQAAALVLHHHAGFSRKEIAGLTGISEEGVKSRLARGRTRFIAEHEGRTADD